MSEELNFDDLTLIEIPVPILGKRYVLREASGGAACTYRNAIMAGAKFVDGVASNFSNLADAELVLLSLCLFDENDKLVSQQLIRSWPDRIVTPLARKVKQISEIDQGEKGQEAAKNGLSSTEAGSD